MTMTPGATAAASPLGNHRLTLENVPETKGSPATWGDLVNEWERYVSEKESQRLVFIGDGVDNRDKLLVAPYSHRFQQGYTEMQYAKIQGFIGGALKEYSDPHLVFLTFSTSTLEPNGDPRPPVDHMDELLDTWGNGVYYELNQVMEAGRKGDPWHPREEWEYLYILEPTTDAGMVPGGYAHAHAALVVDGAVEAARFESVVSRHLVEAPNARGEAHEFADTIEVKRAEELGNPGAYLFKYLGKSWDVTEMEDYERRFAGLLFNQRRQRFRASNGAQRWMQRDEDESEAGQWIFAGVATDDQAAAIASVDDYQEFRIAHESGMRGWLARRRPVDGGERFLTPEEIDAREYDTGLPPGEWYAEYKDELPTTPTAGAGATPDGDRPPPEVSR